MSIELTPPHSAGMPDSIAEAIARLTAGFQVETLSTEPVLVPALEDNPAEATAGPCYSSLFDKVDWVTETPPRKKVVPIGTAASNLLEALTVFSEVPEYNAVRILETARLVTALVDYKVKHPGKPFLPGLIHHAVNTAAAVYRQEADAAGQINDLLQRIREADPAILKARARQDLSDSTTWQSLRPGYSQATAERIAYECDGLPILLLPLTRGGFAGGLDVFLRYTSMIQDNRSAVYPMRFSYYKAGDITPRLTSTERDYLRQWAKGRHVVVFDDDSAVGVPYVNTLAVASLYVTVHIAGDSPVHSLANIYLVEDDKYTINKVPHEQS